MASSVNDLKVQGLNLQGYRGSYSDMVSNWEASVGITGTESEIAYYASFGFDSELAFWSAVVELGGTPPLEAPSAITDFAASDDLVGMVEMTWTDATGTPTPTYNLFKDAAEVATGISSGYLYPTPEGGGTYHIKAINSEGITDSNTDTGQSLAPPVTFLFQDTFTDVGGTLLNDHTPEIGGSWAGTNSIVINAAGTEATSATDNSSAAVANLGSIQPYLLTVEIQNFSTSGNPFADIEVSDSRMRIGTRLPSAPYMSVATALGIVAEEIDLAPEGDISAGPVTFTIAIDETNVVLTCVSTGQTSSHTLVDLGITLTSNFSIDLPLLGNETHFTYLTVE